MARRARGPQRAPVAPRGVVLFAAGYAQLGVAFPAYATGAGSVGSSALALAFAANTLVIVAAQLPVSRLLEHRRRIRVLALAAAIWAAAWLTALAAGQAGATAGFIVALALFGLGATVLAPALGPLVNDLAPEELRGRYNGASALASTGGFVLGPIVAGAALGTGHCGALLLCLAGACILAAQAALGLERYVPVSANRSAVAA